MQAATDWEEAAESGRVEPAEVRSLLHLENGCYVPHAAVMAALFGLQHGPSRGALALQAMGHVMP